MTTKYASMGIPIDTVITWDELIQMARLAKASILVGKGQGLKLGPKTIALESVCDYILTLEKETENGI